MFVLKYLDVEDLTGKAAGMACLVTVNGEYPHYEGNAQFKKCGLHNNH